MDLENQNGKMIDDDEDYFFDLGISKERYNSFIDAISESAIETVNSENDFVDTEFMKLVIHRTKPASIEEAVVVGWLAKDCIDSVMEIVSPFEDEEPEFDEI